MTKRKKLDETTPILQILQGLKDGSCAPEAVPKELIPIIVGYLVFEGWTYPQISQLLGSYDKKVQRARGDFEEMVKATTSLEFVRRKVGYFIAAADNQIGALIRIARSPDASNADKIAAENAAWKIRVDVFSKLQSVGYLPIQQPQISADLFHHVVDESEDEAVSNRNMLFDIENALQKAGTLDETIQARVRILKLKVEKLEVSSEAAKLLGEINKAAENQEGQNEQEDKK